VISKRLISRGTHSYQHNLGAFKISLAEATYVIQGSQIGDWELANEILDPPNDGQGVHEITHPTPGWIQVVDAHGLELHL
jgi:hypothetical protein